MKRKKLKKTGRRKTLIVWITSGAIGGLLACFLFFGSAYLPRDFVDACSFASLTKKCSLCLNDVVVFGRYRSTSEDVLAAVAIKKGESIFSCDIRSIRSRLMYLTWVADATVRRSICGELYIYLTEREPIAVYHNGTRLFLVDRLGTLIDAEIDPCFRGLPVLYGKNAEKFAFEILEKIQPYKSVRVNIATMSLIKERRWNLKLVNGVIVKLPAQNIAQALNMLSKLVNGGHISSGDIVSVDLRSDRRIFLQLSDAGKAYRLKLQKSKSV
ncbi:MAG: FtsQ-type POTRA domain-containing protein [Holosporales bacterium]|jgi:cell division protein FtsQ|nr:FtsQ-type POTRA domain-containing protein [Holosporales bacterium]